MASCIHAVGIVVLLYAGYRLVPRYMAVACTGDEVGDKVGISGTMEHCGGLIRGNGDHYQIPHYRK